MADSLINTAPLEKFEKGDFQADLAQSVATRDARAGGLPIDRSMLKGFQARQTTKDPLYDLRVMEYKSRIMENAAQAANYSRQLMVKDADLASEQRDRTLLTNASLRFKGKPKEYLQFLAETNVESVWGLRMMAEQRQAISDLLDVDEVESTWSKMTASQRAEVNEFPRGSKEWWKAAREFVPDTQSKSGLGKLQAELDAEINGQNRPEVVKRYIGALEQASTNKGKSIYMGMDDNGKPIFQMSEGGATPIGNPTVSTQSMTQQKLLRYEGAMQLITELQRTIKPEFLGARGVAGEMLVDRGLSQLAPEMANRERVDFRSGLVIARESLMREINNDPRFNQADRDEVSKALPSNGVFESLPDAQQRLETVRRVLSQRGKIYATGSGLTAPLWSLSKEEILERHNKFKSSGGKEGIDYNTALDALTRFH